jgi:hypothetical protein
MPRKATPQESRIRRLEEALRSVEGFIVAELDRRLFYSDPESIEPPGSDFEYITKARVALEGIQEAGRLLEDFKQGLK